MKACSERGGRGWWTGQSWLEAPLVSVCAGAAFSHRDTKAATDALHTLCFCPWTVCSRWRPKKATASVTWPGSDTFSFWQTNIFFLIKKVTALIFHEAVQVFFYLFHFLLFFVWFFFFVRRRKRRRNIYLDRQQKKKAWHLPVDATARSTKGKEGRCENEEK